MISSSFQCVLSRLVDDYFQPSIQSQQLFKSNHLPHAERQSSSVSIVPQASLCQNDLCETRSERSVHRLVPDHYSEYILCF